ncbi:permease component of ABC-type sugar transporter [Burkholderia sp. Ch1-1]|uniref:Permease component of ABC-type sugar transporter n=1 Tax=Paraburkholderia dioscoreae TaxID=2604047 RepID=A0A5Q4YYT8_9BURK|nr:MULTISPECIES: sugar ABC transporter permease [Paraburkholderia]EIF35387.1 permease component of ABC-type sugar transporter [Burkholderia sp. Ch1-1]MDR8397268.1 sugar ABC transporter permease [Paraburkholderia sp. USG1]VVD34624.1 Permease component of ABC-type sugar transporter [Paraburkholderia dioscoreae]
MATASLSSMGVRSLESAYSRLGILLIAPAMLLLIATIVYPLLYALWLSLNSVYTPTQQSSFVGLANYRDMLGSPTFWFSLWVTIVWTTSTLILQILCGVGMALLLNEKILFRSAARSLVLFPYFVSTVVAVLVWRWLFNDLYGLLNQVLLELHLVDAPVNWLGQMPNAMISIVLVGTWKYFPFVVIAVLARLQTIPLSLYEAARMDGAGPVGRFFDVTLPQLREVLGVVILLRIIWDFKEFDLLYLMTGGGPVNQTRSVPLLVYQQAFGLNQMGTASTSAVGMMVVMGLLMAAYLYRSQRTRSQDASR